MRPERQPGELAERWQLNAGIARKPGREGNGDRIHPAMPTAQAMLFATSVAGPLAAERVYCPCVVGGVDLC